MLMMIIYYEEHGCSEYLSVKRVVSVIRKMCCKRKLV